MALPAFQSVLKHRFYNTMYPINQHVNFQIAINTLRSLLCYFFFALNLMSANAWIYQKEKHICVFHSEMRMFTYTDKSQPDSEQQTSLEVRMKHI